MVTINEMAEGYIKQITFRIKEAEKDLLNIKQHLEECLNELEFDAANNTCSRESCYERAKKERAGGEVVSTAPLSSEQHGVVDQEAT